MLHDRIGFSKKEASELVETSLDAIAETEVILEINTGAMARGYTSEPYPSPWILGCCAARGIPITINADAHRPSWVDYSFPEARRIALQAGYEAIQVLRNGRWQEERL